MLCRIIADESSEALRSVPWVKGAGSKSEPLPSVYEQSAVSARPGASQARDAESAREIEVRIREAQHTGYVEGEAKGKLLAAEELRPVLERLGNTILQVADARANYIRQTEADVVN